jgi:hypothetical protein
VTVQDVALDASALVVYAESDLEALPVDELIDELRYDTGGRLLIPWYALEDAQTILGDNSRALDRLQALAAEFGVRLVDVNTRRAIEALAVEGQITAGMAHAMLLAAQAGCRVATYSASTLRKVGYAQILDLGDAFPAG